MTITVAKMQNRIVQIVRYADRVGFSDQRGWICVCMDFDKQQRRRDQVKWIPATTRFEWVKEFQGE